MRHIQFISIGTFILCACGGGKPPQTPANANEPQTAQGPEAAAQSSEADATQKSAAPEKARPAAKAHGATPSQIKATATEAAMKFFIVDKDKGPIEGIVITLAAPGIETLYTKETDSAGYAEILVPVGHEYDLVYLSLGSKDINAKLPVPDKPNLNFKFTLRYKGYAFKRAPGQTIDPGFILEGVEFDTAKAKIREESLYALDSVFEYMTHKPSSRIQFAGHSDNVGKPEANKKLSERRAEACRAHLISKGIDGSRIEAVGYGDEQPAASNDTKEGRQRNRRIEAKEL